MAKPKKQHNTIYIRSLGGNKQRGIIQAGTLRLACTFGGGGIKALKREGDFATPRAVMSVLGGYFRPKIGEETNCQLRHQNNLPANAGLKLQRLKPDDGWCDSRDDANYNRFIRLPHRQSAERLYRDDQLYDIIIVLNWNIKPRIKGRGSAVFLHIARPQKETRVENIDNNSVRASHATTAYHPTAGCIALARSDMRRLLPLLHYGTKIAILG